MELGADVAEKPSGPRSRRLQELSPWQLLLFVRCFQPRAFLSAARLALTHYLGAACASTESLSLELAYTVGVRASGTRGG